MTNKIEVDKDEWLALLERVLETSVDRDCISRARQQLWKHYDPDNIKAIYLKETTNE